MFIDYLGGMTLLNEQFARWGLHQTHLNNWLPDLSGSNEISMREMAQLLYNCLLPGDGWLSQQSKANMLATLGKTVNRRLVVSGVPNETVVAHKTGDIGVILGDAALVRMENGQDYLIAVMVRRPRNHPMARKLIQDTSRLVYDHFQGFTKSKSVPE
jgi:beta-lactamase class A